MKWKRFVKESVDERTFKKLLKQNGITKLPSGMSSRRDGMLEWRKERGYAGEKTIERMRKQAEDAGWRRGREMDDAHPDGSWVARGDVYVSPDGQIEMSYYSHYGATSYDNSFSITFKLAGGQVNEADDDENTFARSNRPQIYKYYSDDETPIEEFVKKVRDAEQMVEDIFIQNSDYYENEENPWETFCNDMCDGESPEKAFDLDYYMNQAAYDQLPEDIRKYTHLATGTCDFDAMQWLRGIFERLMPICKDQYNESDDWVGDDGGVEDDINPKFADLRDACDKIDDRGFQWSSGKWRIRPDELGYDWKIYYDGEGWIGTVNYKTREYDVWNTKVVKKNEIKDFLHALNADGFRPMNMMNESSRFGFNVGDEVELTSDVEPNRFSGRGAVPAGTVGEVVAVDKPMRGVIKVKIEDGTVVSVPERKLKMAGTDNEPWEKFKKPPEPPRNIKPERPEDYYMRPTSYGSPRYTGD